MRPICHPVAIVAAMILIAGCGPSPAVVQQTGTAATATGVVPVTVAPSAGTTATPAATPVPSPSPSASSPAAGPVVYTSALYPYRITIDAPPGSTTFNAARVPWDGLQKVNLDSSMTDRARAPGVELVWLAMTETKLGLDAWAAQLEPKLRAWHGCDVGADRHSFSIGDLKAVGFTQQCSGNHTALARVLVVGHGHAMLAFADGGVNAAAKLDALIVFLRGLEWTG